METSTSHQPRPATTAAQGKHAACATAKAGLQAARHLPTATHRPTGATNATAKCPPRTATTAVLRAAEAAPCPTCKQDTRLIPPLPGKSDFFGARDNSCAVLAPCTGMFFRLFSVNLYKEYTLLKSRELEELPRFRVMSWQLFQLP